MAELALYRKYRPQSFKEVLGQDHITKVLESALKKDNVAHAYLFTGSRGIGKTTIARLVANTIGTTENDLYEIDGASNRGIDDVRELREAVNTLPFESQYKVYIIDEVHMLTKEAFNALLKTLEEPPLHVVFILATTEMHKLPDTIISRCEVHTLKKPTRIVLKKMVETVAKKEGFTLEPSAAELIALLAEGSFRDAQSTLQKIIGSSSDKKISREEVELVTGAPATQLVNNIVQSISDSDLDSGLGAIRSAVEANIDMKIFMKLILEKLRAVLLLKHAKDMLDVIAGEFSEDDFKLLSSLSEKGAINTTVLKRMLDAYSDIAYASVPQLPIELALVELSQKE